MISARSQEARLALISSAPLFLFLLKGLQLRTNVAVIRYQALEVIQHDQLDKTLHQVMTIEL